MVGATSNFLLGLMGSCVGRPGGVKDSAVPESLFVSFGSGVHTRPDAGLAAGAGLTVRLLSVLTDLLRTGSLGAGFSAGGRLSSLFHAATRSAITSALTTLCFDERGAAVGVGRAARLGWLLELGAADLVVRTVG